MSSHIKVLSIDLSGAEAKYPKFAKAVQKTATSQILEKSRAFIPYRTGALYKSGLANSRIDEGVLHWKMVYAPHVYWKAKPKGSDAPGWHWVFRTYGKYRKDILKACKEAVNEID